MKGSLFMTAQPKPEAEARLFCFPHAGGAPVAFHPWNALVGPEIECVGVQYPGRGQRWREAACLSMGALADAIAGEWGEAGEKRFAFYGHSFGGLVAFEVIRRLRRAGRPGPEWLFVGASRAPQLDLLHPPIHELPDQDFLNDLQARYGGIPAAIREDRAVMELFLAPMRADLTVYERYRMEEGAPLEIPVTAFAGMEDVAAPASCMEAWSVQTEAGFELRMVPGGHFFPQSSLVMVTESIRRQLLGDGTQRSANAAQACAGEEVRP